MEGLYLRWARKFRGFLNDTYPVPDGLEPVPENVPLPPRFLLRFTSENGESSKPGLSTTSHLERTLPVAGGTVVTLASNERITAPDHFQDVRLLKFDVPASQDGTHLDLGPGDTITLYPKNDPENAQKLIDFMGWSAVADSPIDWANSILPPSLHADEASTLRDLLANNLDIAAVPRRSFLHAISHFASDPDQKERLQEFMTPELLDEYYDYTTRPRRTILEILHEFSSVKVPPERALDTFPMIRGREFSIANGGDGLQRIEIVAALVRYRTLLRKERRGLCSQYIEGLTPGTRLPVLHKAALTPYHGPKMDGRPLVGIATGTGVAPARSLLQHRAAHHPPPAHLFFGFRSKSADFHFSSDWPTLPFLTVHAAQSRPAPDEDGKRRGEYVQDLVRREAELVREMVGKGAIFLVCGGSHRMAAAAREAVLDAIGGENGEERDRVFEGLDWIQEVW